MTRTVGSPASLLAGLDIFSHVNLRCGRPTSAWLRDCAAMRRCPRWLDGSELSHCQMCVSVCALRVSLSLMDANEDGRGVQRRRIGLGRSVRRISRLIRNAEREGSLAGQRYFPIHARLVALRKIFGAERLCLR